MSSSVRSGVITLLHTACGAGILAMPYGFKPFGVIPGIAMISFCALCSLAGLLLQAKVARYVPGRSASFFSLTQIINPNLSVIFDVAIAIKCFGVGVSYMIVVGDLMPQIAAVFSSHELLLNRNLHITLIMLFIVAPLCFLKKLSSLRYASLVALSAVAYLCVLILVHFAWPSQDIEELKGRVSLGLPDGHTNPLTTLPIFVFAYTCHHNMFSVINEQADDSFGNARRVAIYAMSLALALYVLVGGLGYLTFGDHIIGNIIKLYPQSVSTTVGRIAIVLLVMLAFPLQCHPARASVNHILFYIQERKKQSMRTDNRVGAGTVDEASTLIVNPEQEYIIDELIEEDSSQQPQVVTLHGRKFVIITTVLLIASYLLAVSVSSLARVLAIVGATGSTSISFILPGIFGYQLIGSEIEAGSLQLKTRLFKYSGLLLAIWGLLVMVTSLTATLTMHSSH
ncbi:hypothetical protein HG536_0B04420 [Torulaspora globosa]|uniref:Amino acid transporter transmembrane domain-containing protein n=1 Tax=Torulaspora globosa TaxID=48254 RepID=A0A7G3ZDJ2_9SACH|nr:uncharacterized protein HG536_0B04420 [Torulaspora globosa]QLL31578.1 hypothetical protein HG536_0B04420 [Torulaspora globosa]